MSESDPSAHHASAVGEASVSGEAVDFAQLGQATTRLVHDFKNQLGGLKLYASFLKTRLASDPEAAEIVGKIVQGLDSMAENATLVGRMTRPLALRCEPGDLTALARQVVAGFGAQAAARELRLTTALPDDSLVLNFDWQQMQLALEIIVKRALTVAPARSEVHLGLQPAQGRVMLSVTDAGAPLNETQRQQFFSFLTNERLQKTALDLAYAARILRAHGGTADVLTTEAGATLVQLTLKSEI